MIKHDLHIHTYLSDCANKQAFMSDYVKSAKDIGLSYIGFADHAWDENIKGASSWYQKQPFSRLSSRKAELQSIDTEGLKVLLGAEGEFANLLLGIGDSAFEYVDYVIVPHSHTHMKGFVLPDECVGHPEKHANYLIKSFISLCRHEMHSSFFGIAHPMLPIGMNKEQTAEIYSYITDTMLSECASAAKESGVALEVNLSSLKEIPPEESDNFCVNRFFIACKRAGCKFFLGSDAHSVGALAKYHADKELRIASIGLNESDFIIEEHHIPSV